MYVSFDMCLNDQRYFITFIDDCSWYMYLYLFYDKSEAWYVFKTYKEKFVRVLDKKVTIIKSHRDGEYSSRYTKIGQLTSPFARFLQE